MKFQSEFKHFHSRKCTWTCRLWNGVHFVSASKCENYNIASTTVILSGIPVGNNFLPLTHWGRVTHICVSELTIISSDNGLSPGRRQAIIWTNDGILFIGPLGTNVSESLIEIQTFSLKKMHLKMSSAKRQPFCLGLNVLKQHTSNYNCSYKQPYFKNIL